MTERRIDEAFAELQAQGYCVLGNAIDRTVIDELNRDLDPIFAETPFCDGDFYGRSTKRFGSLLKRSPHAQALVANKLILDIVDRTLGPWCDCINLNLTQGIEIHPGAPAQYPHRDQDMWQGPKGEVEYLVNVMWPLSPFTGDNGATLVWPGSHAPEHETAAPEQPIAIEIAPGSALLFLGSTRHCGGANSSTEARRGLIVSYCLGWLKPFENQWLVYPPDVARTFDPDLAALVGYRQHRPNLGNVEGQCPSLLLKGGAYGPMAAKDALLPEQAAALRNFVIEGAIVREADRPN